jgi:hypothetical protein
MMMGWSGGIAEWKDADVLAKIVQEAHDDYIDKVGESEGTNEMEAALSAHEARKAE